MYGCCYPLCPKPATRGQYCDVHRRLYTEAAGRQVYSPRTRNDNRTFRRSRAAFLAAHPICADCRRAAATVLDHVVPHRGDNALFWSQDNWQALCTACHNRKTAHGR